MKTLKRCNQILAEWGYQPFLPTPRVRINPYAPEKCSKSETIAMPELFSENAS